MFLYCEFRVINIYEIFSLVNMRKAKSEKSDFFQSFKYWLKKDEVEWSQDYIWMPHPKETFLP